MSNPVPFKCHSCGHVFGSTTGERLTIGREPGSVSVHCVADIHRPTVLTCPLCGNHRKWRPAQKTDLEPNPPTA
jgi:rubredoxin